MKSLTTAGPLLFFLFCMLAAAAIIILILVRRLRRLEQMMHTNQMADPITGIGNRQYFAWRFQSLISDQAQAGYSVAFIGFDIIRVNQYYGEEEAENQLRYAASVLTGTAADGDITARVSGGGFAAAHICSGEEDGKAWIKELLYRLNQYCDKFGKDYRPCFSAGVYMANRNDQDWETVLSNAQQGYLHAVASRLPWVITNPELLNREHERKQLKKHTAEALENHEFKPFFQYVVTASDQKIIGAETLSRWEHPQKGMLAPSRYIDLLESEGTIAELDFYIFTEACRQLEQWQAEGRKLFLSCNFTRITLDSPDFVQRLKDIARAFSFDHSSMVLEITEDVTERNRETAYQNIRQCKAAGFTVALDDVGSGYSSFADLRDYPIDIVKIDRSILNCAVTPKGAALLESMIVMIHSLGMKALCEGVESQSQYEMLKQMNCDYLQGYYFYRTLPMEEARRYLARQ